MRKSKRRPAGQVRAAAANDWNESDASNALERLGDQIRDALAAERPSRAALSLDQHDAALTIRLPQGDFERALARRQYACLQPGESNDDTGAEHIGNDDLRLRLRGNAGVTVEDCFRLLLRLSRQRLGVEKQLGGVLFLGWREGALILKQRLNRLLDLLRFGPLRLHRGEQGRQLPAENVIHTD